MNVSYLAPLRQSWMRTQRMLFRPFRMETWLVLGFAAFLSEYLSGFGGGGNYSWKGRPHVGIGPVLSRIAEFLLHPLWGTLVIVLVALVLITTLAFMWLSSRGKFIFLDNVVHERTGIVEPWGRFSRHGNALFGFWLGFFLACGALFLAITVPLLPAILGAVASGGALQVLSAIAVGWWVALMVPLGIVAAYTHLFLFQFVVPIMYREGQGVLAAWRRFLPLLRANVLEFLLFGLFYLVALIVVGVSIAVVGIATCCVGLLVLAIPYVGSVLLLPVEVPLRGLGPDFLAQFGPEWSVFDQAPPAAGPATATPPAPTPPAAPPPGVTPPPGTGA